jgi:hypothetical protein
MSTIKTDLPIVEVDHYSSGVVFEWHGSVVNTASNCFPKLSEAKVKTVDG